MCGGCTRCRCTADSKWSCQDVMECADDDEEGGENTISEAIDVLFSEVQEREKKKLQEQRRFVPPPPNSDLDPLIDPDDATYEDFEKLMARRERIKRSIEETAHMRLENSTIKFHNIVDEINEDTLKNSNNSGTIEAQKMKGNLKGSRNTIINRFNKSELSSLHIEYNQPQDYEHHIAENKIDSSPHNDEKSVLLDDKANMQQFTNYTRSTKDKDLSKIVVNELMKGTEVIGSKDVSPISNITFTPENDTLTAMAFIAGNLLNKLWNMNKDSSESFETDSLKHQKINDLLELFKEPLSLRQELFLKNALETLSNSLNENKNIHNLSICETLKSDNFEKNKTNTSQNEKKCNKTANVNNNIVTSKVNSEVAQKLTHVLNLIQQFENTQQQLNNMRGNMGSKNLSKSYEDDSTNSNTKLSVFANVLQKITTLLLPNIHSNKLVKKIRKFNQFTNRDRKSVYGTKLNEMPISIKDKIILDYIKHIQNNPKCLLNKITQESDVSLNLKGELYDSLTEFLKIKSFIDLSRIIAPEKYTTTSSTSTTEIPKTTSKVYKQLRKSREQTSKLATVKERLKIHLQTIINDLFELQNERGNVSSQKLNIADILPCISHIINDSKKESIEIVPKNPHVTQSPVNSMKTLIDAIEFEFQKSNVDERLPSAKVWQRVIENINDLRIRNTRRFHSNKLKKSYKDLKKSIENIDKLSNSYKNYALLSIIPAHKKLMLLKTLEADVSRHKNVLSAIKASYSNIERDSPDNLRDFIEFLDNTALNIKLSKNVLANLKTSKISSMKPQQNYQQKVNLKSMKKDILESSIDMKKFKKPKIQYKNVNKNFHLSREQIIIQLMLNRIQYYLKMKDEEGASDNDINYNIAKKALISLRSGNSNLAKELYKILVENNVLAEINQPKTRRKLTRKSAKKRSPKGAILYALKEPLLQIGDSTKMLQDDTKELIFS